MKLNAVQRAAMDHVASRAQRGSESARQQLSALLRREGIRCSADDLVRGFSNRARLTVNFHPDRLVADGSTVIERLLTTGRYQSQFSTGISNGGLTAIAGGERDLWEERLFSGAYQHVDGRPTDRPIYGSIDLYRFGDGAAPRFGSTYFTTMRHVFRRTTLSAGDSVFEPDVFATADFLAPLVHELFVRAQRDGVVLGRTDMTVNEFAELLQKRALDEGRSLDTRPANRPPDLAKPNHGRAIDDYIEAHIHGGLDLATDVASITSDPSFRGTPTGALLETLAERYDLGLSWHRGFGLKPSNAPDHLRGPEVPLMAQRVLCHFGGGKKHVDVEMIGRAAVSVNRNPERWSDVGEQAEALQQLKKLWHLLVLVGEPLEGHRHQPVLRLGAPDGLPPAH